MADRDVTLEGVQGLLVEHLGDQSEILEDHDLTAVRDGDAGRFLPAMLQRVQAVVRQLGDFLAGRPHPENATFFLRALIGRGVHLRIADGHRARRVHRRERERRPDPGSGIGVRLRGDGTGR